MTGKNIFNLHAVFFILLAVSACVPNRKYVYLQKGDVNKSGLLKDTTLRKYNFTDFNYRIQPEDILSIRFESLTPKEFDFFANQGAITGQGLGQQANPLLIGELVDKEGMVPFPVIGKVRVGGLTVYEAQDTIQKIANQYIESAVVKVRLINFRITILGEVNREGTITLANNRVSMLEAIGLTGGLTDLADKQNVKLIRQKKGKTEVQYINLLSEEFMNSPYYFVNQNDVLIVPALKQRPFRKYFGQNVALIVSTLSLIVLTLNLTK
jgi:polysaccharide export outer membrane protein